MTPRKSVAPAIESAKNSTDSALVQSFKAARRVSTPIVAIETPDPAGTISTLSLALGTNVPVLEWDCARGLVGRNPLGLQARAKLSLDSAQSVNCTESLLAVAGVAELAVVFFHNLHRQLGDVSVVQALWNLRDSFKLNKRTVVGLGPNFQLPSELAGDIIVLDEPLPTRAELSAILDQQHQNAELKVEDVLDDDKRTAALDALVGLPLFTSEQIAAMSLTKTGIDVPKLWERKVKAVENTPGLRVWKHKAGDTSIDELRGIDNVVEFAKRLADAQAFGAIVFIDEGDKAFAGGMSDHTGDSGVSKDQVGQVLSYIEDTGSLGVLLAGWAGTGKTQLVKALGVYSGKPVIVFDLGGMKGGVVGKSEEQIRTALKLVTATAEGRVLFVMTANRTTIFTPELNRRFPDQFFYDVPDQAAREAIWPVYVKKNNLTASQAAVPAGFDAGWSGAEIKRACERAALFGQTVVEAARYIIPSSVSGAQRLAELRREASGRFLSASKPGLYEIPVAEDVQALAAAVSGATRKIEVQ